MADFEIDVGFNTDELKAATSGGGGGGASGGGMANGVKTGLKATGILGLIASLKPILETISFAVSIVASFLGFIIAQLIQFIIPFFKDPFRAFLQLGLFIVNGVITGLEFLLNGLISFFSGGTLGNESLGTNIELPRFQEDIILQAYDQVDKIALALEEGNATAQDLKDAQSTFRDSMLDAFLTKSEFENIKQMAEDNNQSYLEVLEGLQTNSDNLNSFFTDATTAVTDVATGAFNKLGQLFDFIDKKASDLLDVNKGTDFKQISFQQFQNISNVAGGGLTQTTVIPEFVQREQERVNREIFNGS